MKHLYRIVVRPSVGALVGFAVLTLPTLALASTSVSIQSLSPSTSVSVGTTLTFNVSASGFSSPTYSVSDSFGGTSVSNSNIDSSGNFSWTPNSNDVGTHNLIIYVNDAQGDSSSVNETITVGSSASTAPQLSIQGLSSGTAIVGTPVSFTAAASSFSSPSFTISDSFSGSSISNADINSAGYFSWTPTSNDIGTHNIIVYAVDAQGHSANVQEQIVVKTPNITVTSITPGTSINPNTPVTFTVSPQGFTNPTYTLSDSTSGSSSSINSSDINAQGVFTWTPSASDVGTHNVTIDATDSQGHSANTSISIYVLENGSGTPVTTTTSTVSSGLSQTQIQAILSLLQSFGADQSTITNVSAALGGTAGASTATSYTFNNFLGMGSAGADVTALQNKLATLGFFSGSATGYYGSLTQAAVKAFQAANGITQAGYVGPSTRAALNQ